MSKRNYAKLSGIEDEIISMRQAGKTRREIAEHFGLEKEQINNWVSRYNRRQKKAAAGMIPKSKGRPRKNGQLSHENEKAEIERLRMENKLLRDFLQLTGRK